MPDNIDNNTIYVDDGRKRICFEIEGIHYFANISIGELLMPMAEVNEGFDYRGYVSYQLVNVVESQQKPTIEQVISQSDTLFIKIFNCFFANNTEFYVVYDEINCAEVCEHYIVAYCRYCMGNLPQASARINDRIIETFSIINEATSKVLQNIDLSFLAH